MAEGQKGVLPVPEGETYNPDFSNPKYYYETRAVIIAGLTLATICLVLRVYTKISLLRKFGWDDVAIIGAWVFSIGTQADCLYGYAHAGLGIHMWNVPMDMFMNFQKVIFVAGVVYVPVLALAKASLIILYYRIVSQHKVYRYCLYVIAAVVIGYSVAITFALLFACRPIQKAWNASLPGSCIDQNGLYIATAVTNTVTDAALLIVPLPVVIRLNMPTVQKFGLFFMFVVGFVTLITSIIRMIALFPFLKTTDKTYEIGWTDLWINIEANFIVICACLPFLRHFLRRYAPKFIGEGSSGGRYLKNYGHSGGNTTQRSWRRPRGELTILTDEVELAENGAGMGDSHSATGSGGAAGVRIMKEVQWNITEERNDRDFDKDGLRDENIRHVAPGI